MKTYDVVILGGGAAGVFVGAYLGALVAHRIPKGWLEVGFALFILGVGFWMQKDGWHKLS
jgi:uncharacterized membrane protein YfcA